VDRRLREEDKVLTLKLADSSFLVLVSTLDKELLVLENTIELQISVLKPKCPSSKVATASTRRLLQLVLESMITNVASQLSKLDHFSVTSVTKLAVRKWKLIPMGDLAHSRSIGTLVTTLNLILLE